jgi:hypothetical protein
MPISADPLSSDVSIRLKDDDGPLIAARTPVAGAPGWYVLPRAAPVLADHPMARQHYFRLTAVAVTVALIVLVLSMVRADWSEELTPARGIVAADGSQRDEVRAFEEASARPSAELTQASTRQPELESARALVPTHIYQLTAALDWAHRDSPRLGEARAPQRPQDGQLDQSITRAAAAREGAVAKAGKAQVEMTEKLAAESDAATRSGIQLASLRKGMEPELRQPATVIVAPDQALGRLIEMVAAERSETALERSRTELAAAEEQLNQAAGAAIEAERTRATATREAGTVRSEAAGAREPAAAAEVESAKPVQTGYEQETATTLDVHPKLATEAARQKPVAMGEKIAGLNSALDPAHTQEAPPPRSPEAQRDLAADQPPTASPAPSAAPRQPGPEPTSDASPGQPADSAVSVATMVAMSQAAGAPGLNAAGEASMADERRALPAGDIRIFIHYSANHQGDAALAQRLADYLRDQGFTVADIRSIRYDIDQSSVRYFFARDRAASQRLVDDLGRFSQGTSLAPGHASDFTRFLPKPRPGTVEVWLPAS